MKIKNLLEKLEVCPCYEFPSNFHDCSFSKQIRFKSKFTKTYPKLKKLELFRYLSSRWILKKKHIFFPTENTGPAIKPGLGIPSIGRVFSIHLAELERCFGFLNLTAPPKKKKKNFHLEPLHQNCLIN